MLIGCTIIQLLLHRRTPLMLIPALFPRSLIPTGLLIAAALMAGCATTYIKPDAKTNPAPREKFAAFQHFEVKPIVVASMRAATRRSAFQDLAS